MRSFVLVFRAAVFHHDQAARLFTAAADRQQGQGAELLELFLAEHGHLQGAIGGSTQLLGTLAQVARRADVARQIAQRARFIDAHADGGTDAQAGFQLGLTLLVGTNHAQAGQRDGLARLALHLGEAIGSAQRALGDHARHPVSLTQLEIQLETSEGRVFDGQLEQGGHGGVEATLVTAFVELFLTAETGQQQALSAEARSEGHQQGIAELGLEVAALDQLGNQLLAGIVESCRSTGEVALDDRYHDAGGFKLGRIGSDYRKFHGNSTRASEGTKMNSTRMKDVVRPGVPGSRRHRGHGLDGGADRS